MPPTAGSKAPAKLQATEKKPRVHEKPSTPRREQKRAINTRLTILKAALAEFAEKGFEGASIRNIAQRTGLQRPLITYHYKTKDILWRSVAEHLFTEIRTRWKFDAPVKLSPRDSVREGCRTFLGFMADYHDFHKFMLRESRPNNPRLTWLTQTFLAPVLDRFLPNIRLAQEAGDLPPGDPILVNYMLIGIISVLSSLGPEIRELSGIDTDDPAIVDAYWSIFDATVFGRKVYPRGA